MVMAWSEVPRPWRDCFELGWEAFSAGSTPVGAVVVAPDGRVITRGRSRRFDSAGPAGQLAGTDLAHAEVNALAGLPPGRYPRHTLYTTLQPCLLCTAAAHHCSIGTIRFAAADPLWAGLPEDLPALNDHIARRWPRWEGPVPWPLRHWQGLLSAASQLRSSPNGSAARAWQATSPGLVDLARALAADGELDRLRQLPLADAFSAVAGRLSRDISQ